MTVFFAPIARLLGDLVVCLQPLQELLASGEDVHLIVRSKSQLGLAECIPGLAGHILEPVFLERYSTEKSLSSFKKLLMENSPGRCDSQCRATCSTSIQDTNILNLRSHPLQTDFVWGSPAYELKYPGYRISNVISEISASFGVSYDPLLLRPLSTKPLQGMHSRTVLIPGTASPIKSWSTASWLRTYRTLSSRGESCILIGQPEMNEQVRELIEAGIPWKPTPTVADAINIISSAARVISVDTGLMHLAVHQGTPTVGLFRSDAFFARNFPHVQNLFAAPCEQNCIEQEFNYEPNASIFYSNWDDEDSVKYWSALNCLSSGRRCMESISVASVLEAIDKIRTPVRV